MRTGFLCSCFFVFTTIFLFSNTVDGQGIVITDTSPGTAIVDGTVNVGEYFNGVPGINSGFGDVAGFGSILALDSDAAGNINIGLLTGGGSLNDQMAIYFDVVPGGFPSTAGFTDNGDVGRANISGIGFFNPSGRADINFAPGFEADFAISLEASFAGLFQLVNGGGHNFISGTPPVSVTPNHWEFSFNIADLGLSPGDGFNFMVTYGNALDGGGFFRSDEFFGVASSTVFGGNIGINPVTLQPTDFNTFISYAPVGAPIPTLSEWGLILLFLSLLTLGTLYIGIQSRTLVMNGVNGRSENVKMPLLSQLPFEWNVYQIALMISGVLAIICLSFFQLYFGEITSADWFGMFVAIPLFGYMVHLMLLMGKE